MEKMWNVWRKKGMWLVSALLAVLIFGCQGGQTTIGDGKIDPLEAATIRAAVGLALATRPQAVAPAYAVSSALLRLLGNEAGESVTVVRLREAIAKETARLNLDAPTAAGFAEVLALVEAHIKTRLDTLNIPASQRLVVIRDVLIIVNGAAAARMSPPP